MGKQSLRNLIDLIRLVIFVTTVSIIIANSASAVGSQNLFTCDRTSRSGILSSCHISTGVVAVKPQFDHESDEVTYLLHYNFPCGPGFGPRTLNIAITGESSLALLNFGQSGDIAVDSKSSLRLIDLNPSSTHSALFAPGCELLINLISVVPSARQKADWKSEVERLKLEQDRLILSSHALEDVSNAYAVLASLNIDAEISSNTSICGSIQKESNLDGGPLGALKNILRQASSLGLSSDDINNIISLSRMVERLAVDCESGTDPQLVGIEDVATIKFLVAKVTSENLTSYADKHKEFQRTIDEIEVRIEKLNSLIREVP